MSETAELTPEAPKAATKTGWKNAKRHFVTLPSGTVVGIELPDIPELLAAGDIPNTLIDAAIEAANGAKVTPERLKEQAEFYRHLILVTVKEPANLTEEDVAEIPAEDKEMLAELATRQRDFDAIGHHIGGLHKSADWRRFRGFDFSD